MGGDPPPASTNESTASILQAYTKFLPDLMGATTKQLLPTEQAKLDVSKEISPQMAELMASLYGKYMPQLAQMGQDISSREKISNAQTEAGILESLGPQIAKSYETSARQLDPEFYKLRQTVTGGAERLIDSAHLAPTLTGGERAEIERAIMAEGSTRGANNIGSATDVAANAALFGDASRDKLQQQQQALGNALAVATNAMGATRTGFDPVQAALGRPSINTGVSQFTGVTPVGTETFQTGNNFLNQVSSLKQQENQIESERRDGLDRFNETFSATVGSLPSCCFIFMEAYNGKLPWFIRVQRDYYYDREPLVAQGYKKMAKWLVPLMQSWKIIRWLVDKTMIQPLTKHGYSVHYTPRDIKCDLIRKMWFTIWKTYGR